MLAKRIIPCLDIKNGRTVKGVNFIDLVDAGDPVELAWNYCRQGADELVFLDISASEEKRKTLLPLVREIARHINIPFTIGGGISELDDAHLLLNAGADKVSLNSAAVKNPAIIDLFAAHFGSQFVVIAADTRRTNGRNLIHLTGGKEATTIETETWLAEAVSRGAGEILLTSMDHDGTKGGFDLELLAHINRTLSVPLIASGGAGSAADFYDVFHISKVDAALAASVFHFAEIMIPDLKQSLHNQGIPVRLHREHQTGEVYKK